MSNTYPDLNLTSARKQAIIIGLVIAILVISIAAVAAVYTMTSPNSDPLTVDPAATPTPSPSPTVTQPPQATLSKVVISSYHVVAGQNFTLSTTASDGVVGMDVNFYASDGTPMGTVKTNPSGTATLTTTVNAQWYGTFYATATHP